MRYHGNNRRFDNERNGSGYQSGGGRNYNQGGGQQRGNVRGAYKPNTGKAMPNEKQRNERDPSFTGVGNVLCPDGSKMTIFISIWENQDGTLGLAFKDANEQGRQQRGGYDNRQRRNDYRQNDGYQGDYQDNRQRDNYREGGAMSRARPIPPAQFQGQYDDRNPPPADYPDGPDGGYDVNYTKDDGTPF